MRTRLTNWNTSASILGLMIGGLAVSAGCSDQAAGFEADDIGTVSDGVIIGTNDLVKVQPGGTNVPAKYQPYINAFGKLTMGSGSCTATHLGNGIAISAGHCWNATANRQNNVSCSGSKVAWGYTSGGTASTSNCQTILAMQQGGTNRLDYAIFRVSPIPPDAIGVDFSGKATAGTTLTIFSHPGGRTQEWSTTCPAKSPATTQFSYDCDTEGGSSGATVLNDTKLLVTGVHWGGAASGNSATHILSTPIAEFLQPDGGTGGTGGAGGADGGGGAAGSAGKGGADAGDAATDSRSDAPTDGSSDAPTSDSGDGAAGSGGASGAAGASGSGGSSGSSGAAGSAGASGAGGKGGTGGAGGASGSGGAGGKGGASGSSGAGGASGSGGSGGASGGSSGSGGSGGSTGGSAGSGGSGGKGGSSTGGTGGSAPPSDDGCSCRIAPSPSAGAEQLRGLLAAAALGFVGAIRRKRRKSGESR